MESYNYTVARAILSELLIKASQGQPIEIRRKYRDPVVMISKASYDAYKIALLDQQYQQIKNLEDH